MVKQVKPLGPTEAKTVIKNPLIKQVEPLEYKGAQRTEPIREIVKTTTEPKSKIVGGMKISDVLIIIGSSLIGYVIMTVVVTLQQLILMLEAYGGSLPPGYGGFIMEAIWQIAAAPSIIGLIIIGLGFGIQYNRSTKIKPR
ncbi:unnamed protein product [marine sediment metagenome]|uniref:Uncharacterized protein n=1 Tax=marine sediment metagenome TaxID=412755 RepID=X0ZUI9_9ZZZZ